MADLPVQDCEPCVNGLGNLLAGGQGQLAHFGEDGRLGQHSRAFGSGDRDGLLRCLLLSGRAHTSRILPVSSSCIIPCLSARVLSRRPSRAAISASMSESTAAMATCSDGVGSAISIWPYSLPLMPGCPLLIDMRRTQF